MLTCSDFEPLRIPEATRTGTPGVVGTGVKTLIPLGGKSSLPISSLLII